MRRVSPRSGLINRRELLKSRAFAAAGFAAARLPLVRDARAGAYLSVLTPMPPDPAPPGVASYALNAFEKWQIGFASPVYYETAAWPQLYPKLVSNFASGSYIHDVMYMNGWVPEFSTHIGPITGWIPESLTSDLPSSAFRSVTWNGEVYGVVFTLSLLTLYYNIEHLEFARLTAPPTTWDELRGYAKELTRDGRFGWVCNYGTPDGIGGTASYWMAFLQQAGGTMYGEDGRPVFNDGPGVEALQLMIDLIPNTDPNSLEHTGIVDATNSFRSGRSSMMMNWPFMWGDLQDLEFSRIARKVGTSILPAGPAGSASIDGSDAWTISALSPAPEIAMKLINFYLDPEVQKQQAIETGWLPIRTSVLRDPEVQEAAPHARALLDQAQHPYDSFLTPDFSAVTAALGSEIQKALRGEKSAAEALSDASDSVASIVNKRSDSLRMS